MWHKYILAAGPAWASWFNPAMSQQYCIYAGQIVQHSVCTVPGWSHYEHAPAAVGKFFWLAMTMIALRSFSGKRSSHVASVLKNRKAKCSRMAARPVCSSVPRIRSSVSNCAGSHYLDVPGKVCVRGAVTGVPRSAITCEFPCSRVLPVTSFHIQAPLLVRTCQQNISQLLLNQHLPC